MQTALLCMRALAGTLSRPPFRTTSQVTICRVTAPAHQRRRALVLSRVARSVGDSAHYPEPLDAGTAEADTQILKATDELRLLEAERDETLQTAEACAKTSVRLEEMFKLLEKLAFEKVQDGDDAAAREVLQEKAAINEVLVKSNARAQHNYALAMKLAEKIGTKQAHLVALLQQQGLRKHAATSNMPPASHAAANNRAAGMSAASIAQTSRTHASTRMGSTVPPIEDNYTASTSPYGASSRRSNTTSDVDAYSNKIRSWESSINISSSNSSDGRRPNEVWSSASGDFISSTARQSAANSIEEARERLRRQALESVTEARSRIQRTAKESIAEARARIEREDAASLARVRQLVARYRAGEYVPDEQIEWAFQQLERRSWR